MPARKGFAAVIQPFGQSDGLEHFDRSSALLRLRVPTGHPQSKLHVLHGGERTEQIVLLKNKTDALAGFLQGARTRTAQFLAQDAYASFLSGAQRADDGEHRGLARPRRAGDDHNLTTRYLRAHVEQDLLAQPALSEGVVEIPD